MTSTKKRLLYVGFNRAYVNRSFAVLIKALQAKHEVDFFGPGYLSDEALKPGPERWLDKHGPYDLIVFDHYTIMYDEISKRKKPFGADVIFFNPKSFLKYGSVLKKFVESYIGAKLFIVNWDVYGIEKKYTEYLEDIEAYIADYSMAEKTIEERECSFPHSINIEQNHRGFWYGNPTDNWVNFKKANRKRILEVPHAVGTGEFCTKPIESRENLFTVPGTAYAERRSLYCLMRPAQRFKKIQLKIWDHIWQKMHSSLSVERLLRIHHRYDFEISNSKIAYTSGSLYRCPVRKYFEIPALGAMPIGQIIEGFEDLGFQDRVNFIVAETDEDVSEFLADYKESSAQMIVENSRNLIRVKHSEVARAQQLSMSIERIVSNDFKGSYWSHGEYRHY